jgi:hypothetical protein
VHDTGRNKGGVARTEIALFAIHPLLDISREDKHHFLLIGVLVEVVPLPGLKLTSITVRCFEPVVGGSLTLRDEPKSSIFNASSFAITNLSGMIFLAKWPPTWLWFLPP